MLLLMLLGGSRLLRIFGVPFKLVLSCLFIASVPPFCRWLEPMWRSPEIRASLCRLRPKAVIREVDLFRRGPRKRYIKRDGHLVP